MSSEALEINQLAVQFYPTSDDTPAPDPGECHSRAWLSWPVPHVSFGISLSKQKLSNNSSCYHTHKGHFQAWNWRDLQSGKQPAVFFRRYKFKEGILAYLAEQKKQKRTCTHRYI